MVGVAQLVRAPGCGPGGRGFKSHHSPKHYSGYSVVRLTRLLWEQEIGSSNLSTPTRDKYQFSLNKSLIIRWGFLFHTLSYLFIIYPNKVHTFKVHTPMGRMRFKVLSYIRIPHKVNQNKINFNFSTKKP